MTLITNFTVITILVVSALATGCQSSNFRARNLPPELRAAASQKGTDLNLARFSSYGSSNSLLAPGDLLEVTVATGRKDEKVTPLAVRVANDGTVTVPLVGPVPVAGKETYDAGQHIAQLAIQRGIYVSPVVTVDIKNKAVNRITVLGAVENPGVHEIPRGSCDLVTALAAAGGLTEEAGIDLEIMHQVSSPTFTAANETPAESEPIQLAAYQSFQPPPNRPLASSAPVLTRINLANVHAPGRLDSKLHDRDVVMVSQRKTEVFHITGLVNKPGQFEIPTDQDIHLLDAIAMAGGFSSLAADKVFVIRRLKEQEKPVVIQASVIEAKRNGAENIRLAAGDTISIEQTPVTVVTDTITKLIRFSVGLSGRTTVF